MITPVELSEEIVCSKNCIILFRQSVDFTCRICEGHSSSSFLMCFCIAVHQNVACVLLACPDIRRGDVTTWHDFRKIVVSISMDIRWRLSSWARNQAKQLGN